MLWKILIIALVVLALLALMRSGLAGRRSATTFMPVEGLDPAVRAKIDAALRKGKHESAVRRYKAATGAATSAARAAVDSYHWKQQGQP